MFKSTHQITKDIDSHSRIICLLEREKIHVARVEVNPEKQLLISDLEEFEWNKNDLSIVFDQIKRAYGCSDVEIILGEDLANVLTLMVPSGVNDPQMAASEKAKLIFGESYESLGIDYAKTYSDQKNIWMQLFVVKRSFLNLLGKSLQAAQLNLDSIEPLAISLSKLTFKYEQPHLVLWGESYLHATLVHKNQVVASQLVKGDNIYKQIETLLSSLQNRYSITIETIVMATKKLDSKKLSPKIASIKEDDLNPFVGGVTENEEFAIDSILIEDDTVSNKASENKDIILDDEMSLEKEIDDSSETELESDEIHSDKSEESAIMGAETVAAPKPPLKLVNQNNEADMTNINEIPTKSNAKLIAVIVTVVVVLVGMLVGGYFVYQNALSEANQPPVVSQNLESTPTPTPVVVNEATDSATPGDEELDLSTIKLEVLNGSGTAGAAGVLSEELTEAGFEDIETGNADSYDYETTEVRVKAGNEKLYQAILEALEDAYEVSEGDELEEDSDYDAQIIVGQS